MPEDGRRKMAAGKTAGRNGSGRDGGKHAQLGTLLLKIVDGGLAGCIFVVPFLMGGRLALGQLVLVLLAAVVAVAWTLRQWVQREFSFRPSYAEVLLLAGVALLLLQISPLPQTMLAKLAPQTAQTLPLWTGEADSPTSLQAWPCISMTPGATRAALALLLAYGLLFVVTVQRIRAIDDVERLLGWMALSAVLMAGFGLVQLLTSNGKFFWFYEHPFSNTSDWAKGSFTNRNHFAHFLALAVGPLLWWLQHKPEKRRPQRSRGFGRLAADLQTEKQLLGLKAVALGIVLFAGLLSLSRGGVAMMFLAAAICVAVCYRAKTLGTRYVLCLAGVGVLTGVLLTIHGFDRVSDRMNDLSSGSIEQLDRKGSRRAIWDTVLKAIPDYALLGSGAGSLGEVYPMYRENPTETDPTHAENGPLQVLLETGTVGLTLLLAGIGCCAFWCIGGLRKAGGNASRTDGGRMLACIGAIAASLAVSVAHSLVDFVWYVPACMALVAVLAACACRLWQLAADQPGRETRCITLPRPAALAAVAALVVVGMWTVFNRAGPTLAEPHWHRYRIMDLAATEENDELSTALQPYQADEASMGAVERMISELEQVVRHDPDHARAHLCLAAAYLRRFDLAQQSAENAMPLAQIRDATIQSRAAAGSEEEKRGVEAWLTRTISNHRDCLELALQHTRHGLELCPLQGEGYLYIAELRFLEGPDDAAAQAAYVDQALKVRPFDGDVLFEAGRAALLAGGDPRQCMQQCMQYWQQSYRCGRRRHKTLVLRSLAGRLPVAFLLQSFTPDLYGLKILHELYSQFDQPDQLAQLRSHYARALRIEAQARHPIDGRRNSSTGWAGKAAATWLEARKIYCLAGDADNALECAQTAYQCDANSYAVRYALASSLLEHHRFADAEQHVAWCCRHPSGGPRLEKLLRDTTKRRIDAQGRPAILSTGRRSDTTEPLR